MLMQESVKVRVNSNNYKYYKSIGYDIPMYIGTKGNPVIDRNAYININVNDLKPFTRDHVLLCCDNCSELYDSSYFDYHKKLDKYNGKNYCRKCVYKLFKSGKNHPMWKSDKTDEERIVERKYPEYKLFIRNVLERDDYTCYHCHERGCEMEVHHLDGYNWCKEKRTDVSNGITLCIYCHTMFHRIYGHKNNTALQFWEWMNENPKSLDNYNKYKKELRLLYCYEENKVYQSVKDFLKEHNLTNDSIIYRICNHKEKGYTYKGYHFFWYNEFLSMSEEEIYYYTNKGNKSL